MNHRPNSLMGRIAAYCAATPRTMEEIQANALPEHPANKVLWLVQDLVKSGALVNLRSGRGRRCGGLYLRSEADAAAALAQLAAQQAAAPPSAVTPPQPSLTARIVAYCSQPRCMADIEAEFAGQSPRLNGAVYNAITKGQLVNLVDRTKHNKRNGGVYVQTALKDVFGHQPPPARKTRRKRGSVPPPPPAPPTTKRRISYHTPVPPSPLAGGPQWSSLALVNVWEALPQPSQDDHHA